MALVRVRARFPIASKTGLAWPWWLRLRARTWLAVTVALASGIELLLSQWIGRPSLFDFHMYLNAAWAARLGGSIYPDPSLAAGAHAVAPAARYFIYPVPFVVLLLPLTYVPTWVAELCARFGEIAVLTLAAWALIHALAPGKREVERAALAAVIIFHLPIIVRVVNLGQSDTAVLALAALSFLAASRGAARGEWWAGLALGAAALIKPFIGILVLFYLWKRQWRAAAGTLIAAGVGVGLGVLALGLPTTMIWLHAASSAMSLPHITSNFTVSLYGLAVRSVLVFQPALYPAALPVLRVAAWGLVVLGLLVGARFIRPRRSSITPASDQRVLRYGWEFALAITLLLLTFPTIEDLHTSLIAIPVVVVGLLAIQSASTWLREHRSRDWAFWGGLALVALYVSVTSEAIAAVWQAWPGLRPIVNAIYGAHEDVAWLAVPVTLALLALVYRSIRLGKVPRGEGIALLAWSLAAVLNMKVTPIEYGEQAGPWEPHVGTAVGLNPLAGLVPLGIVATLGIALVVAGYLNLER